ncbi:hypothetical protein V1264_023622 [Littorina saxatilis]|uniref:Uncharacterized protein n=1 Tax=Littorina saxatilis TaxID=31220 RepID=A0AAN9B8N3_9CAEN
MKSLNVSVRWVTLLALVLMAVEVHGSQLTNRLFLWTRLSENYASDGKMLTGHAVMVYSHKYVSSQCAMECLRHLQCKSFNFDRDSGRCELNNATHLDHPRDLVDSADSEYHVRESFSIDPEALGPCATDPCNGRGHCIETKNSADDLMAVCICQEEWTGSQCQLPAHTLDWGEWEEWGQCSVTCHRGWRMRKRKCMDHVTGKTLSNLECYGADVEYEACILPECPRWQEWGEWGSCSASSTCGRGNKIRHRACSNGGVPGVDRYCLGSTNQTTPCEGIDCTGAMRLLGGVADGEGQLEIYNDVAGQWGTVCADQLTPIMADLACKQLGHPGAHAVVTDGRYSVSDTGGADIAITDVACEGGEMTLLQCEHNEWSSDSTCKSGIDTAAGVQCNVDGVWTLWTSWSECSVTCENGTRHRTRMCNHPPQMHGGKPCEGDDIQFKPCTLPMCPVDGVWKDWTEWGPCSVTCGDGTQDRTRVCHGPFYGGANCTGENGQRQHCKPRECPVDGVWEEWGDWSACSLSCGNGTRSRERTCTGPFYDGKDCDGDYVDWEACNTFNCPVDGEWFQWEQWQPCNVTCGVGSQIRERKCNSPQFGGRTCSGISKEWRGCSHASCAIDGVWLEWSEWGACSVTCGNGIQFRNRTCEGPFYGGDDCVGDPEDSQTCHPRMCPVDGLWMDWEAWSQCSTSCGGGSRERTRECNDGQHGGRQCEGEGSETSECETQHCPVDGVWKPWAEWNVCSKTCGTGTRARIRDCEGPFYDGANCTGPWDESENCNTHNCPVDGVIQEWSEWTECTLTCAGGQMSRHRECNGPFHGGAMCPEHLNETDSCNTQACPEDGVWEDWSKWSECTLTCGGGNQWRARDCIGPFYGGAECPGPANETRDCNAHHCPVDGYYQDWSSWGLCTVTCGGGAQDRNRTCIEPMYGGQECPGPANETQACNTHNCPVDGYYHDWSDWKDCSVTCGGGSQLRSRICESPKYGGADCVGANNETQECNIHPCPIDGAWTKWSDWSPCNVTCGGGRRARTRECVEPKYGGLPCYGDTIQRLPCADNPCPIPGDWLEWEPWSECTATCDGGKRERWRDCDYTSHGDLTAPCEGDDTENVDCHTFACEPRARTCHEWMERGLTASTLADIDPDGDDKLEEVEIQCDLDSEPGNAITVIGHDSEQRTQVQGWEGAREYEQPITYNISLDHVVSIIDQSTSCKQYIKWECKAALIHNPNDNNKVTTGWLNRTEQLADYFGGAAPGTGACACGMNSTCASEDLLCNCDQNDNIWRFDDGDLTFKQDLPVTAFVAGDTGDMNEEEGFHTLGRVYCWGGAK